MSRSDLEFRLERVDDPREKIRQLLEAWNNRLSPSVPEFVKRYVEGNLVIGIRVRCACPGQPEGDFLIQLARRHAPVVENFQLSGNENQKSMFVDTIQIVKDKQGMILNCVRGIIRLKTFNQSGGVIANALYLTSRSRWIFLPIPEYGKFQPVSGCLLAVGEYELPHEVI